jgi:hypothetical protein
MGNIGGLNGGLCGGLIGGLIGGLFIGGLPPGGLPPGGLPPGGLPPGPRCTISKPSGIKLTPFVINNDTSLVYFMNTAYIMLKPAVKKSIVENEALLVYTIYTNKKEVFR